MYDIAVIGAGVVGSLITRELTKYELKTVLLEKEPDVACGATKANSAIVHSGYDPVPNTLKAKLNVRGAEMMPRLAKELGVHYKNNGSLVLAFSEEEMKTVEALYLRGKENGVPGLKVLTQNELREKEPFISEEAAGALYAPSAGIVCPYGLAIAAAGNAMDNGAELLTEFKVCDIKKTENTFSLIAEDGRSVSAKYVINCAGVYSDKIASFIGDTSFSVSPRYGQYILFDKKESSKATHTIFQCPSRSGKGVLVTPTVHGNLLIGPTAENGEDKEDTSTTAESMADVLKKASRSVKSLDTRAVITSFCGIRAVPSGKDFIIGKSTADEGFINVAGIESPGLSSAPAIAEYVAEIVKELIPELKENSSFNGKRESYTVFAEADAETKNEYIRKDSAYGRIVCRCETVTEGEIVSAIHRNPPARTVDGIKRRLRAGMGRCQGGFCTPPITKIIARELNIPEEQVTKNGNGSVLVYGKTKEAAEIE